MSATPPEALLALSKTYQHDNNSNLTNNNGIAQSYDNLDLLAGKGNANYQYDSDLNRLGPVGETPYSYDTENRLTGFTGHTFEYGADGSLSKANNEELFFTGGDLLQASTSTTDPSDPTAEIRTTDNYVYGPTGPLWKVREVQDASSNSTTTSFLLTDEKDNVRGVLDDAGSLTAFRSYDALGNATSSSGDLGRLSFKSLYQVDSLLTNGSATYYEASTGDALSPFAAPCTPRADDSFSDGVAFAPWLARNSQAIINAVSTAVEVAIIAGSIASVGFTLGASIAVIPSVLAIASTYSTNAALGAASWAASLTSPDLLISKSAKKVISKEASIAVEGKVGKSSAKKVAAEAGSDLVRVAIPGTCRLRLTSTP